MPSRKAWITPEEIPTDNLCRVLHIPNDEIFYANVVGALLPLCYPDNWEQIGMVTPEEAAEAAKTMFDDFVQSECSNLQIDTLVYQLAQNTNGGSITANTATRAHLNAFIGTSTGNVTIPGADDILVIQPGHYMVVADFLIRPSSGYLLATFQEESGGSGQFIRLGNGAVGTSFHPNFNFNLVVPSEASFAFWFVHGTTVANIFFGAPANRTPNPEVYANVTFLRLGDAS